MGQGDSKESGRMKYYKSLGMSAAAQADDGTLRVHTPRILQRYHQQEPRTHPEWESIPSIVVTDEFTHPREMTEMEAGGVTEEVSTNEPLAESAEKTWSPEQDLSDSDLEESIKEKMEIGQDNVETAHLIETITTSSVDTVDIKEGSKQDKPDLIRRLSSKSRKRSSMKNKENAPKRGRLSKKKRHASKEDIWQECMDEYSIKFLRDSKKKKASSKNTPAPKKLDDSRYDDMHAMFAKTLPMPLKTTPLGYASVKDVDESREHNESSVQNWVTLRKVDKDHIASGSKQRGEELVKNIHVPLRRISDNMIQNKEIKEWRYSEPVQVDFRNVLRSTSPRSPSSPDSPHSKTEFFGEDKAFDTSVNHDTTILESSSASLPVEPYAIVDVQSNKSQEESGQSFMRPNRLDIGQEVYHDTTVHDLKMSTDPEVRARYIVDQGIETPTSREYIELTNQTYKESFSSDGNAKSKQQNRKDQNMFGSSLQKGVERSPSVEYMELEAQTVTDTTKGNKNLSHAREANMDTDYYTSHHSILTRDEVISRESKASNDQWNIRKGIAISTDKVTVVEDQRSSNTGILTNKFGTKADTELVKQTNHIQQEDLVPVLVSDKELSTNQLDKKESFKHIGKTSEMTVTKLSSASESESPEVSRKHPLGDTRDQLAISQRSVWQHNKENTQQADRVISPESQAATDISASLYHSSLVESEIDIPSGSTSPSTRTPSPTLEEHMRPSSDIQSSALGKYEDIVTPLASENNLVYDDAHQVFIEKQWDTAISSNHQTFPVSGQIRSSTGHTALEAVPEKVNVSNVSNSEKQQEYTEKEFQNYTIEDVSNSKVDSHAFLSSREMQSNIFPIVKVNNTGGHDESGHAFTKLKVNRDDSNWTMYNPNTSNTKRFGNVLTGTPSRYVSTQQSSRRYGTSPYFWKESGHQGASFSGDQHFVRSYTDGGVKVTKYRHSEHDEVKPGQIEELAKQHFQSNMKMFSEKLVPASPRIQENINVHKKVESVPEVQMESVDEVSMTAHGSVNLQAPSGNGPKLPKANVTTQEHFLPSVVVDESNIYMEVLPAEDNTASNSYKTSTYLRSGDQSEGKTDLQDEIITTRKIKVHSDSGSHARANPNILQDMSAVEETMSIDDRIDSYFKDIDTKSSHAIKSVKEAHDNPDGNQRQITKLKVIRHNEKSTGRPAGLERQQPAESVISKVTSWMKGRDRESESTVVREEHKPDINKRFREEIYIENEAPENFGIATQDTDNEGRSKPEIISKSTTEGIHMEKIVPEINQTSTEKMDIETQRKVDINRSTAEIHLEKGSPKAKERSEKDIESRARSDSSKAFREEGLMPNRVPEKQTLTKEIYIEKKIMPGYIGDAKNRDFLAREGVAVSQEYDEVTIDRTITKELVDVENDMTDESETFESTSDIIGTIFDKIGGRKSKMNSAMDEVSGSEKKNTAIDGVPDEIHHSKKSDSDDSETLQTDRPLNKAQAPKVPKKAENIKMDKQDDKMAQKKKEEKDGKSPHWETPTFSAGDKNPKTNNSNSPNRKFHPETHLPRTHDSLNFSEAKGDFTVPVDNTKSHPSARQPVTRPRPHFKRAYVQGYQPRSFTNTTFETNVDPYEDKSYLSPYSKMLKAKIDEMKNATIHVDLSVDRTQGVGEMPTKVDPSVVRDQDITQDTSATATAYIGGEPRTVTVSMLEEVFFWKKKEPEKAEITTVSESVTTRNETAHINTMKEEMYVETTENKDDNVVPFGPGKKLEPHRSCYNIK
ncbi:uncharacterized protein LOC106174130 [Lingula anatina]|uniref:Uncharacterized protein LOC106174130 n=1 Tax=Lingula anatina TaxID=7574 RepID=A0A1S3JM58_LINAN|nr:uncharacterized protein LOC106174130 [Lingula anatina]|eukprot:XP_013410994.1 uncharacterized protein LOC106174130 [Lingula anatina]